MSHNSKKKHSGTPSNIIHQTPSQRPYPVKPSPSSTPSKILKISSAPPRSAAPPNRTLPRAEKKKTSSRSLYIPRADMGIDIKFRARGIPIYGARGETKSRARVSLSARYYGEYEEITRATWAVFPAKLACSGGGIPRDRSGNDDGGIFTAGCAAFFVQLRCAIRCEIGGIGMWAGIRWRWLGDRYWSGRGWWRSRVFGVFGGNTDPWLNGEFSIIEVVWTEVRTRAPRIWDRIRVEYDFFDVNYIQLMWFFSNLSSPIVDKRVRHLFVFFETSCQTKTQAFIPWIWG